jgi:hypothetical protein
MQQSKVLTFESWVTESEWFRYAKAHPTEIPKMLSDRSQCQDPFFDLFAPSARDRQPMITGLCRCFRNFNLGDRYVYVTRLCGEAALERGLGPQGGPWYLGVASMIVMKVDSSHERAASHFSTRRYVAVPSETPYPPGLAHNAEPVAAASRDSCIVHTEFEVCGSAPKELALTPSQSTPDQWRKQYSDYHRRQVDKKLRAAFCKFEVIDGREALATRFENAPVMSRADWEDKTQNVTGRIIQNSTGKQLATRIAEHGYKID